MDYSRDFLCRKPDDSPGDCDRLDDSPTLSSIFIFHIPDIPRNIEYTEYLSFTPLSGSLTTDSAHVNLVRNSGLTDVSTISSYKMKQTFNSRENSISRKKKKRLQNLYNIYLYNIRNNKLKFKIRFSNSTKLYVKYIFYVFVTCINTDWLCKVQFKNLIIV